MKFKLLEHKIIQEFPSEEEFRSFIEENCSEFLNECGGKSLYRGMGMALPEMPFVMEPRTDRKPKDTDIKWHKIVDDIFLKHYGWRARSAGVFATSDWREIDNHYGTLFTIFPVNGYKYVWSPEVKDLYDKYEDIVTFRLDRYQRKEQGRPITEEEQIAEWEELIEDSYMDTDLERAIRSGHEIMINCQAFAAIEGKYKI